MADAMRHRLLSGGSFPPSAASRGQRARPDTVNGALSGREPEQGTASPGLLCKG